MKKATHVFSLQLRARARKNRILTLFWLLTRQKRGVHGAFGECSDSLFCERFSHAGPSGRNSDSKSDTTRSSNPASVRRSYLFRPSCQAHPRVSEPNLLRFLGESCGSKCSSRPFFSALLNRLPFNKELNAATVPGTADTTALIMWFHVWSLILLQVLRF